MKTKECRAVLQLMDRGHEYVDAVKIIVRLSKVDRKTLEEELNQYC
jgi:hypothetical protein